MAGGPSVSQKNGSQQRQKAFAQRQTSIEEFENQEKEINNLMIAEKKNINIQKNPSEGSLVDQDESLKPDQKIANEAEEGDDEEDYEMKFPVNYHSTTDHDNTTVQEQVVGNDGKVQRTFLNGKKEVIFSNGVRRETHTDGYTIVYFNNNDIKQTYPDSKVVYYFAEAKTTQTTFPDGLQVFKFSNNQIEKHFSDGTKEIM